MNTPTQVISRRLAAIGTSSAFATQFAIQADPQLHVVGLGKIPLPVSVQMAHRLCAAAQPAYHGYKDQTRLDPSVRDTWEIPADRLRLDAPKWTSVLDRALLRISRDLGLPAGSGLHAELHNLLVYAPGQFFTAHQDSEKTDGMLGTLVVTLPSPFTGGEFVVSHQGQKLRARGTQSRLNLIAFYADCQHEVLPVTNGYRIVLTYNLIAPEIVPPVELPARVVAALAADVRRFWQTRPAPRWQGDSAEPPDRLVYLLDHQYTASGLSWQRLKGVDAARVVALRQVAERLDAEIFLTLADVHETWSAEDEHEQYGDWRKKDDEPESDSRDQAPVAGDLIDSEIELRHWLNPDGSKRKETGFATPAELCMNRPNVDCTPFRSEYEGYMGNYGNTVDRWYHRAAVVMWPRERAFVIRARRDPRWAVAQIAGRLDAGDAAQALECAQRLLPFWQGAARTGEVAKLFAAILPVAAQLRHAPTAAALLAPFALSQLTPKMVPWLLQLLEHYGLAWCTQRLQQWSQAHQTAEQEIAWMARQLPALAQACGAAAVKGNTALLAGLLRERWDWLRQHIAAICNYRHGSSRVLELTAASTALLGLIRSCAAARNPAIAKEITQMLVSDALPVQVPLAVLRAAQADDVGDAGPALALVYTRCEKVLSELLDRPAHAADDWSITPPADRHGLGELADPLLGFLTSSQQQRLEWPLAQHGRQLIHQFIDRHELPVLHNTRRSGRPFVLVLEKTPALFKRAAAERQQWKKDLAWLRGMKKRFA